MLNKYSNFKEYQYLITNNDKKIDIKLKICIQTKITLVLFVY